MVHSSASKSIRLCPAEARAEALSLLYRQIDASIRGLVVAEALSEANRGAIDLSGLWIAQRGGKIVGTLLSQQLVGRAGAVWPPEVLEGWGRTSIARQLLFAALEQLRSIGCQIAQAVVEVSAPARVGNDLTRGGMPRITELHYLNRDTSSPISFYPPQDRLDWRTFGPDTENQFRRVLQATYHGSLDMPELEGIRSLDDVIAGHRATGRFDPSLWLLGTIEKEPESAAVILLSEVTDRNAWEVAYLGLTPTARGRGLALASLEHAWALASTKVDRLELAVDFRNKPAVRLYEAAGFRTHDRRAVHLAKLGP